MSSSTTSGRKRAARPRAPRAVVRERRPRARRARAASPGVCAASALSSTTRMRPARGSAGPRVARAAARAAPASARERQAHDELAALARARRCAPATRAAVHLDQPLHQRQADAEAALRAVERAVDLRRTGRRCVAAARRGMPMPLSRDADHAPSSPLALDARARCVPPGVGVLGGVVEQVGEDLRRAARGRRRRAAARRGSVDARASWPARLDQRPAGLDRAARRRRRGRPARVLQLRSCRG